MNEKWGIVLLSWAKVRRVALWSVVSERSRLSCMVSVTLLCFRVLSHVFHVVLICELCMGLGFVLMSVV